MSEDFDKEAERERLREKYEADQEDREATERMSELLLQGATMTNSHCETCGSPIFRYQGQEFCPNCQEERGQAGTGEAKTESGAGQEQHGAQSGQETQAQPDHGQPTAEQPGGDVEAGAQKPGRAAGDEAAGPNPAGQPATQSPVGATTGGSGQPAPAGSLDEARQSLVQTITSLTRRAAATEDPRQAKELLAAAREAAETLATLQGSR